MKLTIHLVLIFCLATTLAQAIPGDLDPTFSGDGKASYDIFSLNDAIEAMTLQQDGKIVAVGRCFMGANNYGMIIRLNTDGTPDTTFNGGGVVLTTLMFSAGAVVIQPDGKIVIGGIKANYNDFALLRFTSTGQLDSTFGQNGATYTDFATAEEKIRDLALQKDGRIVAVGDGSNNAFLVARYTADGIPDPGFGVNGQQTLSIPQSTDLTAAALIVQETGKIVVGGSVALGGDPIYVLKRLNTNGTPDPGFSSTQINFYGHGDRLYDIAQMDGGRIVAVGTCEDGNGVSHIGMVMYGSEGNYLKVNNWALAADMEGLALAIRPDRKIVVAGYTGNYMLVIQYKDSLGFDTSFGNGGILTIDLTGSFEKARAVVIQSDGKIVIGGSVNNPSPDVAFARVQGFGSPLLAEDFSGAGQAWNVLKGNWIEDFGSLLGAGNPKGLAFAPLPWSPSGVSSCNQCTILFPISTTGGENSSVKVYLWYQNASNNLQLILKPEKGKWVLKERSGDFVRKSVYKHDILPGVTYNVGLSNNGESILLSIDGTIVISQPQYSLPDGNVGFKVANTAVKIDQIYIY